MRLFSFSLELFGANDCHFLTGISYSEFRR